VADYVFDYDLALRYVLLGGMIFLSITILFCLVFIVRNPRLNDRIVATNMIGVKTILLIIIAGIYLGQEYLVDVAFIYALLSFLAIVIVTRVMLQFKLNKLKQQEQAD
jgi:multicomponent Na+:H+ antiporter subunit F